MKLVWIMEDLRIIEAKESHKEILQRLLELYQYDLSVVTDDDVDQFGLYGYSYLDCYWVEEKRYPYLFLFREAFAGFALVNKVNWLPENDGAHSIAEFFVLKKYRRQGVGTVAAQCVINRFPGKWEIRILRENQSAIQFWRQVITKLASGRFLERIPDPHLWRGTVFSFKNRSVKSSFPKEFAE